MEESSATVTNGDTVQTQDNSVNGAKDAEGENEAAPPSIKEPAKVAEAPAALEMEEKKPEPELEPESGRKAEPEPEPEAATAAAGGD